MWPLGHAAVAYLCYAGLWHSRTAQPPADGAAVGLLLGSQLPDLVDKPLSWYLSVLPTGRSLAHSLVVIGPLIALVWVLSSRYSRGEYGIAFGVGAIAHVLTDALPTLWSDGGASFLLWPLLALEPYPDGAPSIMGLLVDSLGDPFFISEFVLAAIAVGLWHRDGYPGLGLIQRRIAAVRSPMN